MSDNTNFKVKISDTFCEHEYVFNISEDYSINDLAKILAKGLNCDLPKNTLIRGYKKAAE